MWQLTRYLYETTHVHRSLVWALLDRERDESLFWAYELYFSGFQEDLFGFLWEAYQRFYQEASPELGRTLGLLYASLEDHDIRTHTDQEAVVLGAWVVHLLGGRVSLTGWLRPCEDVPSLAEYCAKLTVTEDTSPGHTKMINHEHGGFSLAELDTYRTRMPPSGVPVRNCLAHVCRFPLRRVVAGRPGDGGELCPKPGAADEPREFLYHVYDHWLYHAASTPFWAEKIATFGGTVDDDAETVVFDDDAMERFYTAFGLEPDEQPYEVEQRFMIRCRDNYLPWETFFQRYGSDSVFRTIYP
jgi:hypothetical protein